ncbi:MAG: hypothetical protein EOP06_09530 [Proteobacteria bacterium]|nr:MAG: hypothetical protein EOP06_09530 [Pseudomonadota bacterium]
MKNLNMEDLKMWFVKSVVGLCTLFALLACVTESKEPKDNYLKPASDPGTGSIASRITVRCHVQLAQPKKTTPCSQTSVVVSDLSSSVQSKSAFKGGAGAVDAGRNVYRVDVSTVGCPMVRSFNGIMGGMAVDAYFERPCGGSK